MDALLIDYFPATLGLTLFVIGLINNREELYSRYRWYKLFNDGEKEPF